MKLEDIFNKDDKIVFVPNKLFTRLIEDKSINTYSHKAFIYSYYGLISHLYINNKYDTRLFPLTEIKSILGYAPNNKKIDYIIKKNGLMYKMDLITDEANPIKDQFIDISSKGLKKPRIKIPTRVYGESDETHRFNPALFSLCMKNNKLGIMGYFIGMFITTQKPDFIFGYQGLTKELMKDLRINPTTFLDYARELRRVQALGVKEVNRNSKGDVYEISFYLRLQLKHWKKNSFEKYGEKCFISGKKYDLAIHHSIPFNKIRDLIFESTGIPIKKVKEYTQYELNILKEKLLELHKYIDGIPLNSEVHYLFHEMYGNDAGILDLLDFKHRYEKGEFNIH